eukprot:801900-Pyramimonas_sp.AAC.1
MQLAPTPPVPALQLGNLSQPCPAAAPGQPFSFNIGAFVQAAQSFGMTAQQALHLGLAGAGMSGADAFPFGCRRGAARARAPGLFAPPAAQAAAVPPALQDAVDEEEFGDAGMPAPAHAAEGGSADLALAPLEPPPTPSEAAPATSAGHAGVAFGNVLHEIAPQTKGPKPAGFLGGAAPSLDKMEADHAAVLAKAAAAAAAAKEDAAKEAAAAPGGKKRPRTAAGGSVNKRPAAFKPPGAVLRASDKYPPMPTNGSVNYLDGKVLPSDTRQSWRVWPDRSVPARERSVPFGSSKRESFKQACNLIKLASK